VSPEEGKEVIIEYNKIKAERDQYEAENKELKESFQYQLEKRLEYFKKYQELKKENEALREQINKMMEDE